MAVSVFGLFCWLVLLLSYVPYSFSQISLPCYGYSNHTLHFLLPHTCSLATESSDGHYTLRIDCSKIQYEENILRRKCWTLPAVNVTGVCDMQVNNFTVPHFQLMHEDNLRYPSILLIVNSIIQLHLLCDRFLRLRINNAGMTRIGDYGVFSSIIVDTDLVDLSYNNLTQLCDAKANRYIRSESVLYLYLNNNKLRHALTTDCFIYMPNVNVLSLAFNEISVIDGNVLMSLHNLRSLDLGGNEVVRIYNSINIPHAQRLLLLNELPATAAQLLSKDNSVSHTTAKKILTDTAFTTSSEYVYIPNRINSPDTYVIHSNEADDERLWPWVNSQASWNSKYNFIMFVLFLLVLVVIASCVHLCVLAFRGYRKYLKKKQGHVVLYNNRTSSNIGNRQFVEPCVTIVNNKSLSVGSFPEFESDWSVNQRTKCFDDHVYANITSSV